MIVAQTTRLLLRELSPLEAPRVFEIYSHREVMRFMAPARESVEDERDAIRGHIENYYRRLGYGLWAVIERETGALIGRCGLLRFELRSEPRVEISYLLDLPYWGKGYATEAATEVVRHAFDGLNIDHLSALIDPENHASARVAERLCFRRQGSVAYKQFGLVDLYERGRGSGGA